MRVASTTRLIKSALECVGMPCIKHDLIRDDAMKKGTTPDGFDCSGLFHFLLRRNEINIFVSELGREARYAREFFDHIGRRVNSEISAGDLVFFSYDGAMPTHMAMYIGDGTIVHKGFVDTSITTISQTGNYPKMVILSKLDAIAKDRRNAGNPIVYRHGRGPQRYFNNPIGAKRLI